MKPAPIQIKDFTYDLPEERIAKYPLPERDQSKLLVCQGGKISHNIFSQLPDLLDNTYHLFFNDTKVIPARFLFEKDTGATIEVFILEPAKPSSLLSLAMTAQERTSWFCTIGNMKRWQDALVLRKNIGNIILEARLAERKTGLVEFSWTPASLSFAEVVHAAGMMPLPPYLKRTAEKLDLERYQTVYSRFEGAVAAPTAGLHFTQPVLNRLASNGVHTDFLTLHVSAGTFMPVKTDNAMDHPMHEEQVLVSRKSVENLLQNQRKTIAVGTTAMRTLESLYWFGALLLQDPHAPFIIESFMPYAHPEKPSPSKEESLMAILTYMQSNNLTQLVGQTSIYIFPGYRFRVCEGLITNFHQPGSTLLLLVAAFIGPVWKTVYQDALDNDYRFLSYGDSSLLLPR